DMTEYAPAVVAAVTMPLTYSIATGIGLGFITYALAKIISGKFAEASPAGLVLALLFAVKFAVSGGGVGGQKPRKSHVVRACFEPLRQGAPVGRALARQEGDGMPRLTGFSAFASLPEERISDKVSRRIVAGEQGMIVWWSMQAGVHV